ncbi:lysoplasmalogenase family protein [Algibacter pectinivorans]|uniref:YhhN-like protein n=1 Tax=Algibacter pectinivorans TaxID=870482 RepID=A0A1I1S3L1_9FLAO|nr:lysoplasmalogenase family protein [Algibacter pectinivorans]SFD37550.1 YhhN-like protein [Algibacter pectinivorans]
MLKFSKETVVFSLLFIIALIIDIIIKINWDASVFRYISKSSLSILLIGYYSFFHKETSRVKQFFMTVALLFFFIGDIFFILYQIELYYIFAIFSFGLAKLFYVFRFSNQGDFRVKQITPALVFCFLLMMLVMYLINDNLDNFFFPTLFYFFISTLFVVFAFLRRDYVDTHSYALVIVGVFLGLASDTLAALVSFYDSDIPFQNIAVMLFYGLSQLFIVLGIVKETNFEPTAEDVINDKS